MLYWKLTITIIIITITIIAITITIIIITITIIIITITIIITIINIIIITITIATNLRISPVPRVVTSWVVPRVALKAVNGVTSWLWW